MHRADPFHASLPLPSPKPPTRLWRRWRRTPWRWRSSSWWDTPCASRGDRSRLLNRDGARGLPPKKEGDIVGRHGISIDVDSWIFGVYTIWVFINHDIGIEFRYNGTQKENDINKTTISGRWMIFPAEWMIFPVVSAVESSCHAYTSVDLYCREYNTRVHNCTYVVSTLTSWW